MRELQGNLLFYLDNDCVIAPDCPSPARIVGGLDGLFMARGHSGRPNSGVLIVSAKGSDIFDFCVDRVDKLPPADCEAPYENGHVIWACTNLPWRPLPRWMNNTCGLCGSIVHHTGPNRVLRSIEYATQPDRQYDVSQATIGSPAGMRAFAVDVIERLR